MWRFRRTGRFRWFRQLPRTLVGRDSSRRWWLKHRSGRSGSREADRMARLRYPARGSLARSCRGTPVAADRESARPGECRSQALVARGSLALGAAAGSSSWTSCCGVAGWSRGIVMDAVKTGRCGELRGAQLPALRALCCRIAGGTDWLRPSMESQWGGIGSAPFSGLMHPPPAAGRRASAGRPDYRGRRACLARA